MYTGNDSEFALNECIKSDWILKKITSENLIYALNIN
jgi:hypothetical protein